MPTPRKNEKQKDFVQRCVKYVMEEGKVKDNKQAVAMCYSMFKQAKKNKGQAMIENVANKKFNKE